MSKPVTFSVNGQRVTAPAGELDLPLVDFLQEDLGLTGTKFCCGIGVCRACTVAVRRHKDAPLETTLACSTTIGSLQGVDIITIESQARHGQLSPLQEAFLREFAFQCGYCTSGFLMAAVTLAENLQMSPVPEEQLDQEIEKALGEHICRCTGYVRYYSAVKKVLLATPGTVL